MRAMVLESIGMPLKLVDGPDPMPGPGEIRLRVEACAVCRTDLHVIDGDLRHPKLPLIPGHEIVGIIDSVGTGVARSRIGRRVGVPWLGHTCGHCPYCLAQNENLCDQPDFTGYTRDGGFATHVIADAQFAFDLDPDVDAVSLAPLLCAGLIGWRCLKKAGDGKRLGIYGFGAAAHIIAQIALWQGREVFAFTRSGDRQAQEFARSLGVSWAGGSDESAPRQLDAAIIFAPFGDLVPIALGAVHKGGRVVCGGIHMSDIPAMAYELLWEERELISVANLTRHDAEEFFPVAKSARVRTHTKAYPLDQANRALDDLRQGRLSGAAVLVP
ncbi:zinc-binding alcohol dehydrogenase family protein [Mesorhizobium sp. M7A.F.Ca.US.011.01.1.1]|uniref:zinc-dependent alcohol dehydrogenase family protein n=1 Tax=Mesorhizobium sp. M7A.F.Ca.US.011.01.1.1 TaxID=2496741 RepID=UPI000FCA5752|nr:zinc-dependent alcohol dehydrogenase family protein [Mesorhizobium sp. M7A.F.Ca.US.011.01.1.1]RUX28809.1 zinc-binding alcohol dehydrogenase family protein [Mesorhizobium sp. M7A.F.Ca.US.011.01.1.1]